MYKSELRSKVHLEYVKAGDAESLNLRECKVCYDLPVRTVFVNCGHIDPAPLSRLSRPSPISKLDVRALACTIWSLPV